MSRFLLSSLTYTQGGTNSCAEAPFFSIFPVVALFSHLKPLRPVGEYPARDLGCSPHLRKVENRLHNASQQILNRRSKGGRFRICWLALCNLFSTLRKWGEHPRS